MLPRDMSQLPQARYVVAPDHPRAPPQRVWDALGAEERARVVRELPVRLPEQLQAEGERQRAEAAERALAELRAKASRKRRR